MKRRNGFTLIELLAVIIILAIIALIATPIILDVIEDSRKSAAKSESRLIVSGIENYCAAAVMKDQLNNTTTEDICSDGVTNTEVATMVNLGNAKVTCVTYANGRVEDIVVVSNGYDAVYTDGVWATELAAGESTQASACVASTTNTGTTGQ